MITQEEREQLDAMMEQEADFYAPLMFLVLSRLPTVEVCGGAPYETSKGKETPEPVRVLAPVEGEALREIITTAYADLNERMAEEDAAS